MIEVEDKPRVSKPQSFPVWKTHDLGETQQANDSGLGVKCPHDFKRAKCWAINLIPCQIIVEKKYNSIAEIYN